MKKYMKTNRDYIETIIYNLRITVSKSNIHINDSYLIMDKKRMYNLLNILREYIDDSSISMDNPLNHRANSSLIREWVAHNNAYKLNYKRERTGSVDMNYPQKWYVKLLYFVCSIITL